MPGYVAASTLKARLSDGAEIALLDVREHGQYGEGHPFLAVPLPYSRFELGLPALVPNRAVRLVMCDGADGVAERAAAPVPPVRVSQGACRIPQGSGEAACITERTRKARKARRDRKAGGDRKAGKRAGKAAQSTAERPAARRAAGPVDGLRLDPRAATGPPEARRAMDPRSRFRPERYDNRRGPAVSRRGPERHALSGWPRPSLPQSFS